MKARDVGNQVRESERRERRNTIIDFRVPFSVGGYCYCKVAAKSVCVCVYWDGTHTYKRTHTSEKFFAKAEG